MSERIRIGLYVLLCVAGGVAVALGFLDAGDVDQWVAVAGGFLLVGGGGTALKHIRGTTTQTVVAVQDVIDALTEDASGRHAESSRAERVRASYGG